MRLSSRKRRATSERSFWPRMWRRGVLLSLPCHIEFCGALIFFFLCVSVSARSPCPIFTMSLISVLSSSSSRRGLRTCRRCGCSGRAKHQPNRFVVSVFLSVSSCISDGYWIYCCDAALWTCGSSHDGEFNIYFSCTLSDIFFSLCAPR